MTTLVPPLGAAEHSADELLLTDFTSSSADCGWYVVNDNVMGGRSEGTFQREPGKLHFTWTTVDIPSSRFIPRFRGYQLDGPELDPGRITGMGLMIYDKQDGPFELHLASVHAYAEEVPFSLTEYRWQRRVLVVSAASDDDGNLRTQLDELASTPDEFAGRDMLLVTLVDDAVSMAGGRELTDADVSALRDTLGIRAGSFALRLIGKDGTVKLSRDSATPMTEIYALIDTMPMRQRERSER
jgi:hypothetical protein